MNKPSYLIYHEKKLDGFYGVYIEFKEFPDDIGTEVLEYVGYFEGEHDAITHVANVRRAIDKHYSKSSEHIAIILSKTLNTTYWNWLKTGYTSRENTPKNETYIIPVAREYKWK